MPRSTWGTHHWEIFIKIPRLMSCLLPVPLPALHRGGRSHCLYFTGGWAEVCGGEVTSPGAPTWWERVRVPRSSQRWCSLAFAKGFMLSLPMSLWTAKVAFGVLLCLQSFLTVVKGGGGTEVDASCIHQMLRFLGNTWEEYVVLISPVLTGSACSTVKFTVFSVCQNLMTFRRPGTYLLKKLLLSPYHTAPGAMGRSLIAQWYWYNR